MQQLINTVAGKVGAVMTDMAAKMGFTLVLDAGDQQSPTVLYAVPSTDITKAIIDAYNVKSGIPARRLSKGRKPRLGCDAPQAAACSPRTEAREQRASQPESNEF